MITVTKTTRTIKNNNVLEVETPIVYQGRKSTLVATVRFNDDCMNGKNSLSVTGVVYRNRTGNRDNSQYAVCGCIHDIIAKNIPSLREAIRFHLWDTKGAMYHVENGFYHLKNSGIDTLRKYINWADAPVGLLKDSKEEFTTKVMLQLPEQLNELKTAVLGLGLEYKEEPIQPEWKKKRYNK